MQIIKNQTIDQMAKQIRQETAATDDAIVAAQVADIIKNVRENGDEALKTYSATFDGVFPKLKFKQQWPVSRKRCWRH